MKKIECYNCNLDITKNYPKEGTVEAGGLKDNVSVNFSFCSNKCFQEFEIKRKDSELSQIFDFVTIGEASQAIRKAKIQLLKDAILFLKGKVDTSEKSVLTEWIEQQVSLLEHSDDGGKT